MPNTTLIHLSMVYAIKTMGQSWTSYGKVAYQSHTPCLNLPRWPNIEYPDRWVFYESPHIPHIPTMLYRFTWIRYWKGVAGPKKHSHANLGSSRKSRPGGKWNHMYVWSKQLLFQTTSASFLPRKERLSTSINFCEALETNTIIIELCINKYESNHTFNLKAGSRVEILFNSLVFLFLVFLINFWPFV